MQNSQFRILISAALRTIVNVLISAAWSTTPAPPFQGGETLRVHNAQCTIQNAECTILNY